MALTLFMPLMGPTVTPWSMGIMTAFPVLRLNILSMRIDVPLKFALSFYVLSVLDIRSGINVLISTS
jgi:hypothetical protein